MKTIWTGRVAQTAVKYADNAPTAAICCIACRTCVTTNGISFALAAIIGVGAGAARLVRRVVQPS